MISYIKGTVEHLSDGFIIIEAQGIGYGVMVSTLTVSKLSISQHIKLYTYMSVREDGISLFGFLQQDEYELFLKLISVSGLGPKTTLGILSIMPVTDITLAIITEDVNTLSKAPGIGKKTAARIVLDLKDKLSSADVFNGNDNQTSSKNANPLSPNSSVKQDAIEALIALGISRSDAVKTVMEVAHEDMDTEKILKAALKKFSKG